MELDSKDTPSTSTGSSKKKSVDSISDIRSTTQFNTALELGAQAGLLERANEINKSLEKRTSALNSIYNFSRLLIDGRVVPPVIVEASQVFAQDNTKTSRETEKVFHIQAEAFVIQTPPIWQDYLMYVAPSISAPHTAILPENNAEKEAWKNGIQKGWDLGVEQADEIFEQNIARLDRDYQGMLLYHKLERSGIVSSPYLGKADKGIVVDGNTLRIADKIYRLVKESSFTSPDSWKPIIQDRNLIMLDGGQ